MISLYWLAIVSCVSVGWQKAQLWQRRLLHHPKQTCKGEVVAHEPLQGFVLPVFHTIQTQHGILLQ